MTTPGQSIGKLTTSGFLDEIHHLLWIEPGDNRGTWDEGWNCRDHALLSGVVCQLLKMTVSIIYGQATFVQGPITDAPPVGLCQNPHAWLGIDGLGFLDLSPNLTRCREALWRSWPLQCIAMSRCRPDGVFSHATSDGEYAHKVNTATHLPGRNAIYFGQEYNNIDMAFVEKPFEFANSPLSVRLSKRYDSAIYAKAAIHLFKMLNGENKSLRHLLQDDAWATISRQPGNPVNWLKMKGGIK